MCLHLTSIQDFAVREVLALARSLVDAGATFVHGHHSHLPRGVERYDEGLIMYGGGNFVVDPAVWQNSPNTLWSVGLDVDFCQQPLHYSVCTYEICQDSDDAIYVRDSNDSEATHHKQHLQACQRPLLERALLEALEQEISIRCYREFYRAYLGFSDEQVPAAGYVSVVTRLKECYRLLRDIVRRRLRPNAASKWDLMLWYHVFACLSHRQSVETSLGVLSGELPDLRTDESRLLVDEMMPWTTG